MLSNVHLALEADRVEQGLQIVLIHTVQVAALDHRPSIYSLDRLSHRDAFLRALSIGQQLGEVLLAEAGDRSIYVFAVEDLLALDTAANALDVEVVVQYDEVVFVLFQKKDEEVQLLTCC